VLICTMGTKKTKIVCTIGPVFNSPRVLQSMRCYPFQIGLSEYRSAVGLETGHALCRNLQFLIGGHHQYRNRAIVCVDG